MTRHTQLWIQAGEYPASLDRELLSALWPAAASRGVGATAVGGNFVAIDPGVVVVPSANNTGSLLCTSDAVENVAFLPAPAAGLSRFDLILAQTYGADLDGGVRNDWIFLVIQGVESASPTEPPVPPGAALLHRVTRTGGAGAITQGDVLDRRPGGIPLGGGAPVGSYLDWPNNRFPAGYLWADGRTVNIADWPELFDVLRNDYGGSSGAGTFALPDTRDRFNVGVGSVRNQAGLRGGSRNITEAQMPSHGHGVGDPGHAHDSNPSTAGAWGSTQGLSNYGVTGQAVFSVVFRTGGSGTGIWIAAAGGGQAYDQPYISVYTLIRAR